MQIRLPPAPRDRAARYANALRRTMAKNRQEFEVLSCVVGLIVGVALGALSMGIARPPLMAMPAAHASSAAAHARAVRTQQDSMLGL